jgi:hypothetical protein
MVPLAEGGGNQLTPTALLPYRSHIVGAFRARPEFPSAVRSRVCEGRPVNTTLAPKSRSAVSNHRDLLPGLDGRSAAARRFRDLVLAFISDQGGLDGLSEVKLGLIRHGRATRSPAHQQRAGRRAASIGHVRKAEWLTSKTWL